MKMPSPKRVLLSAFALILSVTCSIDAACPVGDVYPDCTVNLLDLRDFAVKWLDSGCLVPGCRANIDGIPGVDMEDFALLAENWHSRGTWTLVINEFMAENNGTKRDPFDNDYEDWIELYNYGDDPIDIGGMYMTDDSHWSRIPVGYSAQTTIVAGGYLLLWADSEPEQGPLHLNFGLGKTGDMVGLYDAYRNPIDSITFGPLAEGWADKSYGRLPDANDHWEVFGIGQATPGQSNRAKPVEVLINEIMYHPGHAINTPENIGQEYIELYNKGEDTVNVGGWRFTNGVDYVIPGDVLLGSGGYLVVAADVNVFTAKYPGVTNVVGGWDGHLSNSGEAVELVDGAGVIVDRVEYADQGAWAVRFLGPVEHAHRGWEWSDEHDGGGKSLELVNPAVSNEYGQNWSASSFDGGTPGGVNFAYDSDIAPLILDVEHFPIIPGPSDTVTVTARVIDEQPTVAAVRLHYRVDRSVYTGNESIYPHYNASDYNDVPMFDDGAHGDGAAGDGLYGAQIPAYTHGRIIEFFVEARDAAANSRTWPAPSTIDGTPEQVTNLLYQVDSSFDPEAWAADDQPIYYIIMTEMERARLEDIVKNHSDLEGPNSQMNGTFISADGVDVKVRYIVGVRNRGHGTRNDWPNNYHVNFVHGRPWKNVTAINLNTAYTYLQSAGGALFRLSGVAQCEAGAVQVRTNGQNLAESGQQMYSSYVHVEAVDNDFAANHFPDDGEGNAYKAMRVTHQADLSYEGALPGPYRQNYFKETNASADDWSDLIELCYVLDTTPEANYVEEVNRVLDAEQWLRLIAVNTLLSNAETTLANGNGDDYYLYRGFNDTRFILVQHDLDSIFGMGQTVPASPVTRDIFLAANIPTINRLIKHPQFVSRYYYHLKDLIETTFSPEQMNPFLDELLGGFVPAGRIQQMKDFVVQRNAYVLSHIPSAFTINSGLSLVSGYHHTAVNTCTLSGTAEAIKTRSVLVNGEPAGWLPVDGQWSISGIALNPGINRIIVQTYDGPNGTGNELESGYIDIWYDTGSTNDYPKEAGGGLPAAGPLEADPGLNLNVIVRDSYLPGVPVLVRVELLADDGTVRRDIWNAAATLSDNNPAVNMSANQVTLYNGMGSAFVTFTGSGDFTLTVDVMGVQMNKVLADWSGRPVNTVSGTLGSSASWSGIYHITGGDYTIPAGVTLTLQPGALVLIDGVSSGENGTDIDVGGSIQSLGTATSPITFTAYTAGLNWGEIDFRNAGSSTFRYTNISQANRSPAIGHSDTGPTIRASNTTLVFDHASLTDNAGKLMHATSGCDLTFHNCLFARSIMGPEISSTAILFEDGWITDMHAGNDADGIYINPQGAGRTCILRRSVAANMDDDGIDLNGGNVTIEDFIVRDCKDKGISAYGGQTTITRCLVVENNKAPEDPTRASVAAKAQQASTAVVNIDHTTIVASRIAGREDYGIQSHNKYGYTAGTIVWNVTNSIIDATNPIDVQAPYLESDVHVDYSDVFAEVWPGAGNINADPLFVDAANHDYRLQESSPCIDAGNPAAEADPDLTVTDQGYFWFNQDPPADMVWTPQEGPYRITGEMTIPFGATLTIMPGTTVFFEANARMVISGRLVAEGLPYELLRFTRRPGVSGTWNGLQFADTVLDNRVKYAVFEYGQTDNGMIGLDNSNLLLDHSTLDHTGRRRIRTLDSSLIVSNCWFTDIFAPGQPPSTDNLSEHIWGRAPDTGWFIIENNVFGLTKGHNDAVDVDGPSRPNPIPQILNNVFLGSGDDALDLESDAHIEGNLFANIIKDQWNTASGESNAISAGAGKDYVMVRNTFHNVQHVAQVKDDAFLTFVNNTVVDACEPAIYFDLGLPGRDPGRGAYVEGAIFWNTPEIFAGVVGTTDLTVNHSILPIEWHGFGVGNIYCDPVFVDPNGDFHLKAGSGAIGSGAWGLDMGAYVPAGAAICGEPYAVTYRTSATLTVGGPGIVGYKYSVNSPTGPWSAELSVDAPIVLSGLANGASYTVYAVGKNSAGVWQSEDSPTASHTWTIDVTHGDLLINEVLAHTHGSDPDIIELYYDGPGPINLAGMSLSDNSTDPGKFVFSSANVFTTIMNPGDYMVLYGDLNTGVRNHVGFGLLADGEALYLYDKAKPDGSRDLIDSVEFGPQINEFSIGRAGWERSWRLNRITFGMANIAQPLGNPDTLKINEWLANGQVLFDDDFIELYNPHSLPVALDGMYLTDNPITQPGKHRIVPLSFIPPQGYTVFRANDGNEPSEVDFKLSADGEMIGLFDADLNLIDQVLYGPQTTDVSQGRAPDGSSNYEFFELPTPGVANAPPPIITTTTTVLAAESAAKRAIIPTGAISDDWKGGNEPFNDTGWNDGTYISGKTGGVGYDRNPDYKPYISYDVQSKMDNKNQTCYIRIPFTVDGDDLADFTGMTLKVRYDDGFVAYVTGTQLETATRNFSGTPTWNSGASGGHSDSAAVLFEYIDVSDYLSALRSGNNVLAIHGLNDGVGSTDFLISAELEASATTVDYGEFPYPDALDQLAGLRITELMYHSASGSNFDYIELQNISDKVLKLDGVQFLEGVEFVFPNMELEAGEYVVVVSNLAAFRSMYGMGPRVAGAYSGGLSGGGEDIVLTLAWPLDAAIMRFGYSDRWYPTTDGGGQSLHIIDATAHPATWDDAASWRPAAPTPGAP